MSQTTPSCQDSHLLSHSSCIQNKMTLNPQEPNRVLFYMHYPFFLSNSIKIFHNKIKPTRIKEKKCWRRILVSSPISRMSDFSLASKWRNLAENISLTLPQSASTPNLSHFPVATGILRCSHLLLAARVTAEEILPFMYSESGTGDIHAAKRCKRRQITAASPQRQEE